MLVVGDYVAAQLRAITRDRVRLFPPYGFAFHLEGAHTRGVTEIHAFHRQRPVDTVAPPLDMVERQRINVVADTTRIRVRRNRLVFAPESEGAPVRFGI